MSKPPKVVIPGLNRGSGVPGGFIVGRLKSKGPAQLLNLIGLRTAGLATAFVVTTSTSLVQSIAHSETVSLSTSVSSSLSSAVSVNVTQSTSLSQISSSLSSGTSSTTSLSTAVSTVDANQSTSLSQVSSSLSGAISSTASLSTAVSTVDSGQAVSLSAIKTAGNSLKLPVSTVAGLPSAATEGAGAIRAVSDALTPTLGVVIVGGGGVYTIVLSDGTNWIAN